MLRKSNSAQIEISFSEGAFDAANARMCVNLTQRFSLVGPRRDEIETGGRRFFAVAALVLSVHLAGLTALDLLDRERPVEAAGPATEIPVEIVPDDGGQASGSDASAGGATAPAPAPSDAQPPAPAPPSAAQPTPGRIVERAPENQLPQKSGAHGSQADRTQDKPGQPPDPLPYGALAPLTQPKAEASPVFLSPETYAGARRAAAPDPANDNYRAKVLGMVASTIVDPERPRPKALAVVAFSIDDSGALTSISLARKSGHADLDAEALDYVRRAAPFPPPPAGADRSFAAAIPFGME